MRYRLLTPYLVHLTRYFFRSYTIIIASKELTNAKTPLFSDLARGHPLLMIVCRAAYLNHFAGQALRRAFLCGEDAAIARSFEHRHQWIENRLKGLAKIFSIDNHFESRFKSFVGTAFKLKQVWQLMGYQRTPGIKNCEYYLP